MVWIYILAGIGALTVLYFGYVVLVLLLDGILFALGWTILSLLNVKWGEARKQPKLLARFVWHELRRAYRSNYGMTTEVKQGPWTWKPYFHYRRVRG
jgi:hypothetical protein